MAEVMCPECGIITSQPVGTKCLQGCDRLMVIFENTPSPKKGGRGFGSMDPEKQREIARKGGRAAHMKGTAHEWTKGPEGTAAKAGKRGGQVSRGGRGKLQPGEAVILKEFTDRIAEAKE
jgi:uncharacterized protein